MLRSTLLAVLLSAAVPAMVLAQTSDDLKNDEKTTGDVLIYGMGYSAQRYSPLTQINKQNVNRLVPVWGYSLADLQGGESAQSSRMASSTSPPTTRALLSTP